MALHSLYCADVPLRNCSLTHPMEPVYNKQVQPVAVAAVVSEPMAAATGGDGIAQSPPVGAYGGGHHGAGATVGAEVLHLPGITVASRDAANEVLL